MAFVHTSVNRTSQSYLSNEQRYNYTTPKSFLEFIRLYQSLLRRNGRELRSKMERLENGLLKLHSTSAQVSSVLPVLLSTAGLEGGKGSPFPEDRDHSHVLKTKPGSPEAPASSEQCLWSPKSFIRSPSSSCVLCAKSLQSCLTLCIPMDCSLPGSSVHGILQARILEWVAVPSSRGSSRPRDQTCVSYVSCIGKWVLYH